MRKFILKRFILVFFLANTVFASAQVKNKGAALLLDFSYGIKWTGADLASRFGQHFSAGGNAEWLTAKQRFIFAWQSEFLFGQKVREDVIAGLRTPEGRIYANDKSPADIQLRMRGFYLGGAIGKLFPLSKQNYRSGIKLTLGMGLWQHKIRIQEDPSRSVPQLEGNNKPGYDRLTNGLAFRQFLGYQLLSTDNRVNFFIGIDSMQGFTEGRRSFNFDTRQPDSGQRFDLTWGIRVGWILPFYSSKGAGLIYY